MSIRTDIGKRLAEGRQLARKKHVAAEVDKRGNLRAGNSGLMGETGDVAGSCHRKAHLRQLGIEIDPPDAQTLIMFQMGIANEEVVYQDLIHTAFGDGEKVLREEEIPIVWYTGNGTKVTGRPDLVICSPTVSVDERTGAQITYKPELGIELKSVASVWTTRQVLFDGAPKLAHLVQAGHYAWQLNVPFRLIYKQYGIQAMPDFAHKFFPRKGEKGSEYMEFNEKGNPKSIRPFEIVYELQYTKDGVLQFRKEGVGKWRDTIVSIEDIKRFYEFVSRMRADKTLGPIPMTVDSSGKELSYSDCKYCPLQKLCNGKEAVKDYTKWIRAVETKYSK